jgi:hypothetical protein
MNFLMAVEKVAEETHKIGWPEQLCFLFVYFLLVPMLYT